MLGSGPAGRQGEREGGGGKEVKEEELNVAGWGVKLEMPV
jgi:hypothetical protein